MTQDQSVSFHPYFKIHSGKVDEFKALIKRFVEKTKPEAACLYYAFTMDGDVAYCREGYVDAAALMAHGENVQPLIAEALQIADFLRVEVHGPAAELDKLREPLAPLNCQFFALEGGFRQ